MKRSTPIVMATLALVCLSVEVGVAASPRQTVEGSVKLASPTLGGSRPAEIPPGCAPGIHRRLALAADGEAQGYFGFHFDVAGNTWGRNFVLEATGGMAPDPDIVFYESFGDAVLPPNTSGSPGRSGSFETGKVPFGSTKAIVCLAAGADATFVYEAGSGVKFPK